MGLQSAASKESSKTPMAGVTYDSRIPLTGKSGFRTHYAFPMSRYHRQTLIIGDDGQSRLAAAHIAIIGMGALGCGSADLLARAGVGHVTLIDRDLVELTNLQRQTLYTEQDAAESLPKAEAARRRLSNVNSSISLTAHIADLTPANIETLIPSAINLIIDGTDNFQTRYLLNDLAVQRAIPLCYGGVIATRGMQATFLCDKTHACLRCIFDSPPPPGTTPTCDTVGVIGPAVSIISATQAADALKILIGKSDLLSHTLLDFDLWTNTRRRLDLRNLKRPDCPACGHRNFEFLNDTSQQTASLCGQNAVQLPGSTHRLELESLAARLTSLGRVSRNPFFVRLHADARPPGFEEDCEVTIFADGRAIVKGTDRPEFARAAYARFIGQ